MDLDACRAHGWRDVRGMCRAGRPRWLATVAPARFPRAAIAWRAGYSSLAAGPERARADALLWRPQIADVARLTGPSAVTKPSSAQGRRQAARITRNVRISEQIC